MKITSVECRILDGDFPFVWVHTDEGLTGIGECFRRQPYVTRTLIDDLLAPDIVKVPGFTEFIRIDALASAFNVPITVHNTQPILSTVAHLHFCAVSAMVPYSQEYNIEPISIRDEWPILKEPLEVVDGHIAVPTGPGLGVELDEDMVRRLSEG